MRCHQADETDRASQQHRAHGGKRCAAEGDRLHGRHGDPERASLVLTEREQVGLMMDKFRAEKKKNGVWVMFTGGERPGVHVSLTDELVARGVKAGDLVARIAAVSGGKGGGRPHFASGGLGDPAKLGETRAKTPDIVRAALAQGTN